MLSRAAIAFAFLAAACSPPPAFVGPAPAPTVDPAAPAAVPSGPVLFEPEQLILPPEEFPLAGFRVARDAPLTAHGWERQFAADASPDFRWFTIRVHVLEPDVPSAMFVAEHDCDATTWPDERPSARELQAAPTGDASRACRYEFGDGLRVLYYTTGFRNVGIVVGMQPRRDAVTDRLAFDWLAAIARRQIAIIGRVLAAVPPPALPSAEAPDPMGRGGEERAIGAPAATPIAFEPPVELPAAIGGRPYAFSFCRPKPNGSVDAPRGTRCDATATDPRGGRPPYEFKLGPGGFTPLGLALSPEGVLAGTPMPTTDARTYRFTVCVADRTASSICREVRLKVDVPR